MYIETRSRRTGRTRPWSTFVINLLVSECHATRDSSAMSSSFTSDGKSCLDVISDILLTNSRYDTRRQIWETQEEVHYLRTRSSRPSAVNS
jgi:hypothetical protein